MTLETMVDWSGWAPSPNSKKHIPQPPSKIAAGVGVEEVNWKPGRHVSEKGMSTNGSILGGPVLEKNPLIVGSGAWKTEAQAASAQTKTTREQMTQSGRSMFIRGKAMPVPMFELARRTPFDEGVGARLREENPYSLNEKGADISGGDKKKYVDTIPSESLVEYRSGSGTRSFLEGLGAEVAASNMSSYKTDEEE